MSAASCFFLILCQDGANLPAWACCVLQVHPFDTAAHEARLEAELKRALGEHREESLGHTPTHWDEGMAFLLMPSLAAYEQEAVNGQPATSNEDFQQCIRRSIPAGCMFKGFPQHHRYGVLNNLACSVRHVTSAQLGTRARSIVSISQPSRTTEDG